MFNILFLFVIIPVLTLGALFLTHNIKQVRAVAATGASLLLIAALYLCYAFVTERAADPDAAMLFVEKHMWFEPLNIHLAVGVDGISVLMILLSAIIVFTGTFASWTVQPLTKEYFLWFILLSTGVFGYLLQQFLVYLHGDVLYLHPERGHHRIGRGTHGSHSYRVHADTVGPGYLSGRQRGNLSAVVHSVGKQDHHATLGLGVLQAGHGVGQAVAYRGTVIYQAALYLLDEVDQGGAVGGQGRLGVALAGEDHHSDTVRRPLGDELYGYVLGRLYTVRVEVAGQHTGGHVQGQDDVDALGVGPAGAPGRGLRWRPRTGP